VATSPWFLTNAFVAATLLVAMAAVLLVVRCPTRANRPFAAYLLALAGMYVANAAARLAPDGSAAESFWEAAFADVALLLLPLLVYFAVQFGRPLQGRALTALSVAVLVSAAALQVAKLVDPCLHLCAGHDGPRAGPLWWTATLGALLLWTVRARSEAKRTAVAVVASGMALVALLDAILALDVVRIQGPLQGLAGLEATVWGDVGPTLRAAAALPAFAILATVVAWSPDPAERRRRIALAAGGIAACAASAAVIILDEDLGSPTANLGAFVSNLWSVVFAAVVAFALLRHRLFGLDSAVKFTVSRSTIVATFLAMFFVVSKIVETVAQEAFATDGTVWGALVGAVAAGLLLFAIRPLERLGERVADTVLPGHRTPEMERKLRHYHEHVQLVWSDGLMGIRERSLLEKLRVKLGISPEDALRIEAQAAERAEPPSTRRRNARHPA
jgi:hypothetical protein